MAAHQFLERNDLSQMFLDQVVDFILKNTKGVTIGQQAPSAADPFTGECIIIKTISMSRVVVAICTINGPSQSKGLNES